MDLFKNENKHENKQNNQDDPNRLPLAEQLRPQHLTDFVGLRQDSGPWRLVEQALKNQRPLPNLIFWGPPGTGKTSLAQILARTVSGEFISVHSTTTGAKELRDLGELARRRKLEFGQSTLLFIDEIHRLNKAQQDVLLPYSERGDLTLIGATTENPSYELNSALLSRCQVMRFVRLDKKSLLQIFHRSLSNRKIDFTHLLEPEALDLLLEAADGDARRLLTIVDSILSLREAGETGAFPLSPPAMLQFLDQPHFGYQKSGDDHYDCISAFIKSVRGSDPDGAIYYLARMLESGESPVFIARRLVILASEDVGNADPRGLPLAVAGLQAVELVGMPEAGISLAQVTTYLASAPKSNASYLSFRKAQEVFKKTGRLEIPYSLRSDKTPLARQMGYGKGYQYSHDSPHGYIPQDFLPQAIRQYKFYEPKSIGFEKMIIQYQDWLKSQ